MKSRKSVVVRLFIAGAILFGCCPSALAQINNQGESNGSYQDGDDFLVRYTTKKGETFILWGLNTDTPMVQTSPDGMTESLMDLGLDAIELRYVSEDENSKVYSVFRDGVDQKVNLDINFDPDYPRELKLKFIDLSAGGEVYSAGAVQSERRLLDPADGDDGQEELTILPGWVYVLRFFGGGFSGVQLIGRVLVALSATNPPDCQSTPSSRCSLHPMGRFCTRTPSVPVCENCRVCTDTTGTANCEEYTAPLGGCCTGGGPGGCADWCQDLCEDMGHSWYGGTSCNSSNPC